MRFLVKVRVDRKKLAEFGEKLRQGGLDRSLVQGETYCLSGDPAVGYSVWEAPSRAEFERVFRPWKAYYSESEASELIGPNEAMMALMKA
jgi:hypothetical protein